jgi:hypothetical protein
VSHKFEKTVMTRGELISEDLRRRAMRHTPVIGWLELLHPLLKRVEARPTRAQARFGRVESAPSPQPARDVEVGTPNPFAEETNADLQDQLMEERRLQGRLKEILGELTGGEVGAVRIHDGRHADGIAREHHAKAVTIGRDVFFRKGMLRPAEPDGMALLAHEATHVVQALRPNAAWRRATAAGIEEDEAEAAGRERAALRRPLRSGPGEDALQNNMRRADVRPVMAPAQSPVAHPMKADADAVTASAGVKDTSPAGGLEELKRTLFRDLVQHLRVEFERGA